MPYQPSRSYFELRERAMALVASLALSRDGADLPVIVGRVAEVTQHHIEVSPQGSRDWETVTGLLLVKEPRAQILCRKSDRRWYQVHTVLHECGHLLWKHSGCETLPAGNRSRRAADPGETVHARGGFIIDFQRDVDFSNPVAVMEAEAEMIAQLLSIYLLDYQFPRDAAVFGG